MTTTFDWKDAIKAYAGPDGSRKFADYCHSVGITDEEEIRRKQDRIEDWASDGEFSY